MTPDRHVEHLLIGGGIASASAAQELAGEDVLLVGRELDPPYHRPPITKELLRGEASKEDGYLELPDGVEVLTRTSVLELDTEARTAKLSSKETVGFDRALVATGAMVRRLNVDGSDKDGIHYLRAPMNATRLRDDVAEAEVVVCVGGSYIGCEVAASLTALGKRCVVLMQEDHPLERHFGARAGAWFRGLLESRGVEVRGGVDVEAFTGDDERVAGVRLAGGDVVAGDAVVLGVGAQPDVMLARKAGLTLGDSGGVACSAVLETSAPGVFAAGDLCEYDSVVHGRRLRVEHEEHAAAQGRTAARNMRGADEPHREVPYFFSDLADWASLEYVGPAEDWASEEVDGSPDDGAFAIRYLDADGALVACLSVGGGGDLDAAREQIGG